MSEPIGAPDAASPEVFDGVEIDTERYIIQSKGLASGYGSKLILNDITAHVHRNKITCVIGGSGCGKSTFLRTAMGEVERKKGWIRLLGEEVYNLQDDERAQFLTNIGFMYQYGALLASITVEENLSIPLRAHTDLPPDVIEDMIRMKLEMMHLGHAPKLLPGELSGGMRKRVGLARAIMLDPDVVFCDEPSAGLDPITACALDDLMLSLKELMGMTLVIVTHELDSIRHIADHIIMLDKGYVHFNGTLQEALTIEDPKLRTFFDRKAEGAELKGRSIYEILQGQEAAT